jgi:hypothetical protein
MPKTGPDSLIIRNTMQFNPKQKAKQNAPIAHKTDSSELYYFGKYAFVKEDANVTLFDIDEFFEACSQDDDSREMIYRMLGQRGRGAELHQSHSFMQVVTKRYSYG